jgi:hypothetical protein
MMANSRLLKKFTQRGNALRGKHFVRYEDSWNLNRPSFSDLLKACGVKSKMRGKCYCEYAQWIVNNC